MFNNDGILIKGNKDGINTTINMNKFACFEDMLQVLIKKLSKLPEPHPGRFVCAAAYYDGKEIKTAIGEIRGNIIKTPRGKNGFGYDPLFIPDGYNITTAEMPHEEKNKISHRYNAFKQLRILL